MKYPRELLEEQIVFELHPKLTCVVNFIFYEGNKYYCSERILYRSGKRGRPPVIAQTCHKAGDPLPQEVLDVLKARFAEWESKQISSEVKQAGSSHDKRTRRL